MAEAEHIFQHDVSLHWDVTQRWNAGLGSAGQRALVGWISSPRKLRGSRLWFRPGARDRGKVIPIRYGLENNRSMCLRTIS